MAPHTRRPLVAVQYATAYSSTVTEAVPGARWSTDEATALLTDCIPCRGGQLTAAAPPAAAEEDTKRAVVNWAGIVGIEGQLTGDGRMIETNALMWDEGALPFFHVRQDQGYGHAGKLVVGDIRTLERRSAGVVWGTGTVDLGCEESIECARLIGEGLQPGVSMDLDSVSFEIRVRMELLEEEQQIDEEGPATAAEDNPVDDDGRVTVLAINDGDEVMVTTGARIRGATSVGEPAFAGATIELTDTDWRERLDTATAALTGDEMPIMVASGAPVAPPAAWFADPQLDGPTPLRITPEGRVYGHLATWGTCHTSFPGQCITPPSSPSDYSYFLTGGLITAEGTEVAVGQITMDTNHADRNSSASQAMEHYDHTGRGAADIAVGEDAYGIWFSGGIRPSVTDEQRRVLLASPVSGDWRTFRRNAGLELMAALSVNVQGFPVPRPQGLVASGQMESLVAAGMIAPGAVSREPLGTATVSLDLRDLGLTDDDLRYLRRLAAREAATDEEAASYARRIEAAGLAARIHAH